MTDEELKALVAENSRGSMTCARTLEGGDRVIRSLRARSAISATPTTPNIDALAYGVAAQVAISRMREREIFRQIKAPNTRSSPRRQCCRYLDSARLAGRRTAVGSG